VFRVRKIFLALFIGILASSNNKADLHDIAEILLYDILNKNKVAKYTKLFFYFCLGYTGQDQDYDNACPKWK
jgi:hypothetical protein